MKQKLSKIFDLAFLYVIDEAKELGTTAAEIPKGWYLGSVEAMILQFR